MKINNILFVFIFVFTLIFGCFCGFVNAADKDIAEQYSPIFYFEGSETCYPVDVSYHIDNSYLYMVGNDQPIDESPSIETISEYLGEGYYLDNQKGTIDDDGIINDYKSQESTIGYTVYSRVYSYSGTTVIQYWMFYAFNKGTMNQHEGDWEMVQVILSNGTPTQVMYSQHHSGQKANWNQVEKNGDHIKVYVSRGSHANYLRSFSGVLGVANDIVGANGKKITDNEYNLVLLDSQPWLDFSGRWGWFGSTQEEADESSILGRAGPNGPKFREDGLMWDNPDQWGSNLIQADDTIFTLEMILYNFVLIFIVVSIVTLSILIFRIYRRYKKTGLGPRIISMLYIDGLDFKSIGNILCIVAIIIAIFSLITPWYIISNNVSISGYETEGMENMMTIDGINGVQITIPGASGPIPMGAIKIPFSLLIGISLVFLVIATIGIAHSKKLSVKYLSRGAKLFVPVLIIIIIIMILGMFPFESLAGNSGNDINIGEIISKISSSPTGGQQSIPLSDVQGQIELKWGFGLGAILLLISAMLLVISGGLEFVANIELFPVKKPLEIKNNKVEKLTKKPNSEKKEKTSDIKSDDLKDNTDD